MAVSVLTLTCSLALAAGDSAAAMPIPTVPVFEGAPYQGQGLAVRPYVIVYSGDGSEAVGGARRRHGSAQDRVWGRIHWATWSASQGRGKGENWIDDCIPDCATGTRHPYAVDIHVYRPGKEAGHEVFTRMTLTYTKNRPPFQASRSVTLQVTHDTGGFFWG